jgi:molecular chaperone GrpE
MKTGTYGIPITKNMANLDETTAEESQQMPEQEEHPQDENPETSLSAQHTEESSPPADATADLAEGAVPNPALEIQPLLEKIENLEQGVAQLTKNVEQLSQQVVLIPRQVRQLGAKVDDVTESISQPRVRDMLNNFLLLHDLIEQMALAAESEVESAKNYQVLRDQILQALQVNGISLITEAQRFDPELHKAVETIACETPDEDGEIVRVYRPGFRTERTILRYAEVVVKRFQKPDNAEEEK